MNAFGRQAFAFARAKEQHPDWQQLVDLQWQLQFSKRITATTVRPDSVLVSQSDKQAATLELTVLLEECLEVAFERKFSKYTGLISNCQQAGWRMARCFHAINGEGSLIEESERVQESMGKKEGKYKKGKGQRLCWPRFYPSFYTFAELKEMLILDGRVVRV
ncbi:uncharacterized protein AKAME5_002606200 [Lates japonicus]|uniref:Uncharacterized protein n=1 Tax=Lates japonicus TaxID=270547 RepID=A0AAD3RNS3_LATJO|nr:uncharacterized protein AKAME5_002606200 [Lates japonicus]